MRNYDGYQLVSETVNLNEGAGKTTISILGIVMGLPWGVWPLYRAIRASYDEKTRRCGIFRPNTTNRQICMLKVKIETLEKIKSASKDPKVLKQVEKKLNKFKIILSKESSRLDAKGQKGIEPSKKDKIKWV